MAIPQTFDNYKERMLSLGMETCSTTEYKGFYIFMRAYAMSGIRYEVYKMEEGKKIKCRGRHVNFAIPAEFLQHAKNWIDNNLKSL